MLLSLYYFMKYWGTSYPGTFEVLKMFDKCSFLNFWNSNSVGVHFNLYQEEVVSNLIGDHFCKMTFKILSAKAHVFNIFNKNKKNYTFFNFNAHSLKSDALNRVTSSQSTCVLWPAMHSLILTLCRSHCIILIQSTTFLPIFSHPHRLLSHH